MLLIYAVSTIVAGVLLLLSLIGADHDSDTDVGGLHAEGGDHDGSHGFWLPFFSLRFYTYFFAGFGATGLLLHFLTRMDAVTGAWMAGAVGLVAGLAVSIAIRVLKVTETSGSATDKDVLGKEGKVLVAIRGATPGRIRCIVRGDIIDFLAFTEEDQPIEAGETVVVVAMENGRAQVVPRDVLFEQETLPQRIN